jgi:hypothetical protein
MKFALIAIILSAAALAGCSQTTGYSGAYGSASGYAGKPSHTPIPRCYTSAPPSAGCVGND